MTSDPHYHVGYVVPDLAAAMDVLGRTLGISWTEVSERPRTLNSPEGHTVLHFHVVYSAKLDS